MKSAARTDVGMCRIENQDTFSVFPLADDCLCGVVCDGMGGEQNGGQAAALCKSYFEKALWGKPYPEKKRLLRVLAEANQTVYQRCSGEKGERSCSGTTLVCAVACPREVTLLWVGDSRAYLFQGDALVPLTRDHSYVQALISEGKITGEEAQTHPMRHALTRAVGCFPKVEGEVLTKEWMEGDVLLLCSDGLYNAVGARELKEILREGQSLKETVHEMICAANAHGGEDNITALLLKNTKEKSFDA